MEKKIERFENGTIELFAKKDGGLPVFKGYACKWNEYSALMYGFFYTIFDAHMLDGVLEKLDLDCKANISHDNRDILARYYPEKNVNTLSLTIDETGLLYEFTQPDTTLGRDTAENVRLGNLVGCSMAVEVLDSEWTGTHNGYEVRRLIKCSNLLDICLTPDPAFPSTEVSLYSNQMTKEDYLSMRKQAAPEGKPKSYFSNKFRLLGLDRK